MSWNTAFIHVIIVLVVLWFLNLQKCEIVFTEKSAYRTTTYGYGQTNKQTDKCRALHNVLGGRNNDHDNNTYNSDDNYNNHDDDNQYVDN